MIFRLRAGLIFLTFALTAIVLIANCVPHPPAWLSFWGQSLVFEFLGGVALAILYQSDRRVSVAQGLALIIIGLGLVIALKEVGAFPYLPRAIFAGVPAWLIVSGVILMRSPSQDIRLLKLLSQGGEASYSIYLFHPFIIRMGTIIFEKENIITTSYIYMLFSISLIVILSYFIRAKIERPLERMLRPTFRLSKIHS